MAADEMFLKFKGLGQTVDSSLVMTVVISVYLSSLLSLNCNIIKENTFRMNDFSKQIGWRKEAK